MQKAALASRPVGKMRTFQHEKVHIMKGGGEKKADNEKEQGQGFFTLRVIFSVSSKGRAEKARKELISKRFHSRRKPIQKVGRRGGGKKCDYGHRFIGSESGKAKATEGR